MNSTEAPLLASKGAIRASVPECEVLTCHLRLRVNEGDVLLRRQVNVLLRQLANEDDEKEGVPVTLQTLICLPTDFLGIQYER